MGKPHNMKKSNKQKQMHRPKKDKYIYFYRKNKYFVYRFKKGKKYYLGLVKGLDNAIKARDELIKEDWSAECILRLRKKYNVNATRTPIE